ncbi:AAA domain-containing protein [Kribbella steppae]|uniref:AAA domain-containing protein n=1 Tax=Kribbella steppae TaxID=2512223 RepID=A0A4R2HXF3_9ACTN|nr:ATP-binding protein [Kribbella steppae]TCO36017.1 AAA domain-containing protein [Kribbella steppae]
MTGLGIAEAPGTLLAQDRAELRCPADSVVVLAGIPGAGKSTLLRRLFPDGGDHQGVRVFDSERLRARWMPVLGSVPYAWWRPLLHLAYYVKVLSAMRTGPMILHDCATRPWVRRLIGWRAKRSGLAVHLVLLDVPGDVARSGQWARGRVVRSGSMETHCRRWPDLLAQAAADPSQVVPGAVSAVVLSRGQASRLERIVFESAQS